MPVTGGGGYLLLVLIRDDLPAKLGPLSFTFSQTSSFLLLLLFILHLPSTRIDAEEADSAT